MVWCFVMWRDVEGLFVHEQANALCVVYVWSLHVARDVIADRADRPCFHASVFVVCE